MQLFQIVRAHVIRAGLIATVFALSFSSINVSAQEKLKPGDVVAKHLEALGSPEARNKSRIIQGKAVGTFRLGGSGSAEGGAVIASQDVKSLISIVFGSTDYPYERVGFDGKTVTTGELQPGIRSKLGVFFMRHEMPIREGLLGGVLSTAWPLLDVEGRKVKLKSAGTKKNRRPQSVCVVVRFKEQRRIENYALFRRRNFSTYSNRV